jgi:GTPase SAR1 family protein
VLSNFLADPTQNPIRGVAEYRPTKGARIVELANASVWDVSGDEQYEGTWAATGRGADGVIMVFNTDIEGQEQQLLTWFDRFVEGQNLTKKQCIIFANQSSHMKGTPREPDLPAALRGVDVVATNTLERQEIIQQRFEEFLREVRRFKSENQNAEELSVLNG